MPTDKHKELLWIAGEPVAPGESCALEVPIGYLYTQHDMGLSVRVLRGKKPGPIMFVSAAIHGDELDGMEIITRLLQLKVLKQLRGTLILVPVVNVLGFLNHSRYLPDRRDLNRSFPGSAHGSMAARLARTFLKEIVSKCTHGIDLHTAAIHRGNLPQIRVDLQQPGMEALARAFGVPVILDFPTIPGSLRATTQSLGIPLLLYECGEALRFNEMAIRAGVRGVVSVMRALGMLPAGRESKESRLRETVIARSSHWVRAPVSGVLRTRLALGQRVHKGEQLGYIGNAFGENAQAVISQYDGLIVGINYLPLVDEGNALFHVATFDEEAGAIQQLLDRFHEEFDEEYNVFTKLNTK